jgi:hypothetical protein
MSQQYNDYLTEHRGGVVKAYLWLKENTPEIFNDLSEDDKNTLDYNIKYLHDASKNSLEEYDAYDKYFYGNNKSYEVVNNFKYAWLHHIHNNPHHWQYWVLVNDDPNEGVNILEMPDVYIIEMICDWWSFSWKIGDLSSIFEWYRDHSEYIKITIKTRSKIEGILHIIREKLGGEPVEY